MGASATYLKFVILYGVIEMKAHNVIDFTEVRDSADMFVAFCAIERTISSPSWEVVTATMSLWRFYGSPKY